MKEQKAMQVSQELSLFMEHHPTATVVLLLLIVNEELLEMDGF